MCALYLLYHVVLLYYISWEQIIINLDQEIGTSGPSLSSTANWSDPGQIRSAAAAVNVDLGRDAQ